MWGDVPERKHRLFGIACCRRIRHLCPENEIWQALEVAEQYSDGLVSELELQDAAQVVKDFRQALVTSGADVAKDWTAAGVQVCLTESDYRLAGEAAYHSSMAVEKKTGMASERHVEEEKQCDLFREIIGNPFRRVDVDPAWLSSNDGAAAYLAQNIYDERAFNQMPELADALESAGCTNDGLLTHCRQEREHVRGCWVLDLLLGK